MQPKRPTGTEAPTSPDDAVKEFVSARGTPFSIKVRDNGLYFIEMNAGGKRPPFCDELFTSHSLAENTLTRYLRGNDVLGVAKYPDKD